MTNSLILFLQDRRVYSKPLLGNLIKGRQVVYKSHNKEFFMLRHIL